MERSRKGQDAGSREPGPDLEALRRLEALQPAYERLRADRIRAESDVERLTAELAAARAQAREELGTDDEAEIRRMIEEARAENAAGSRPSRNPCARSRTASTPSMRAAETRP